MSDSDSKKFVSRAGEKLNAALDAFALDVTNFRCADLGCNVGGFTDCLLQRGAESIIAVDTGYGDIAWTLRKDPRVTLHERTNALHCDPPTPGVDLAVIDVAWTPQQRILPAAIRFLDPAGPGLIVTLVKPHFEYEKLHRKKPYRPLTTDELDEVHQAVLEQIRELGLTCHARVDSPIVGKGGNREWLLHLTR